MKCNWKELTLGDVTELTIDYRGKTPKKLGGDWSQGGYPVLSAKNIKTGQIVQQDTIRFLNEEMYHKWMKDEIQKGDIIVTSEAPFGQILYWNSDEKIVLGQRLFGVRIKEGYDSKFIYYYMTTTAFQAEMDSRATGTTVIGLRQPELMKCRLYCPNIDTQRRISKVLMSIDEKIVLNNKINNNLEQQMRALFRSLFVDNAKSTWKEGVLSDLGTIVAGGTPSKSKPEYYAEQGIAWITPKDLSLNKSKFISHGENDISEFGFSKSSVTKMPAGTVLFSSRAPIGYIAIAANELTTNQGFKSIVPNENTGTAFLYFLLKWLLPIIERMASGSTFKEISGAGMKSVPVVIPDNKIIKQFNDFCNPFFQQQKILESENIRLSNARDVLLPKLMTGEIDVSDLEL